MITRQLPVGPRCFVLVWAAALCIGSAQARGDSSSSAYTFALPVFVEASGSNDLREAPAATGIFLSPFGANLSFCSVNGCYPGKHLAAQVLVNMTTQIDATAQEVGLFVNATSKTGKTEQWRPRTLYSKGSFVRSSEGALYQAVSSGRSGTSSGPSGLGDSIADGDLRWAFRSTTVHDGKTALGAGLNMVPGSGQGWALVSDLTVQKGVGDENAFGYENDCANYNKDSDFGVSFLMTCLFQGGQGKGTFPMFAYRYVAAGDGSSYGAHFGDFFNGAVTIKDAVIADATNAINTIRVVAGSKHESVFLDRSSSTRSIDIGGNYKAAIDMSGAKVQDAQIRGRGWQVTPDGTITAAGFHSSMNPPRSSSASCSPGDIRFGENYVYICVKQSRWKRAALNDW